MFPKTVLETRASVGQLSALRFFSVNALLPLEAPSVPGRWVRLGQILEGGLHNRRGDSCGCGIVERGLLARVRVAAGVLLDCGHPQPPGAVRGGDVVGTWALAAAAAAHARHPGLGQLGQGGGRGPACGGGGMRRLDDAHGR